MRGGWNNSLQPNQLASDKAITEEITKAIKNDDSTAPYADSIHVYTIAGVVTLSGRIDSQAAKLAIGEKPFGKSGVKQVINDIEVVHLQQ